MLQASHWHDLNFTFIVALQALHWLVMGLTICVELSWWDYSRTTKP